VVGSPKAAHDAPQPSEPKKTFKHFAFYPKAISTFLKTALTALNYSRRFFVDYAIKTEL
jgi:hypothetical protein